MATVAAKSCYHTQVIVFSLTVKTTRKKKKTGNFSLWRSAKKTGYKFNQEIFHRANPNTNLIVQ